MQYVKALHIFFMVTWMAGLFYLPRLFVYHAMATDQISLDRFKIMERKLFYGIMTPGAILTIIFGTWVLSTHLGFIHQPWLHAKLSLVGLLVIFHVYLGRLLNDFKADRNKHGHVFYRILNEVPIFFLLAILILVKVKPWQ